MLYVSVLVLAAALSSALSSPQLSELRDCHGCQLQRFNFTALNRYPASQLGVLQLFKLVTYQYLQYDFRRLSNSTAVLRVKCLSHHLDRCASAVLVQEQDSGQGRVFLQTIRSADSRTLSLDNDWLEVSITEPSDKTTLFNVCDDGKVFWKIGIMERTSVPGSFLYRELTETLPCWNYEQDFRHEWKTSCNISTERYRELANEMRSLVWTGRKEKQMKIVVFAILLVTAIVACVYILLGKSFVRVGPT